MCEIINSFHLFLGPLYIFFSLNCLFMAFSHFFNWISFSNCCMSAFCILGKLTPDLKVLHLFLTNLFSFDFVDSIKLQDPAEFDSFHSLDWALATQRFPIEQLQIQSRALLINLPHNTEESQILEWFKQAPTFIWQECYVEDREIGLEGTRVPSNSQWSPWC